MQGIHIARYAMAYSVCLYVRPSVTSFKTAEYIATQ